MTDHEERALDAMMRRVGSELIRKDDAVTHQGEAMLAWLAADLRDGLSGDERDADQRDAGQFAARMRAAQLVRRAELHVPRRELRYRTPPLVATASQAIAMAHRDGCAALLDLAAAAGDGRELWDEACEWWLELPTDLPKVPCIALRVAGDSMAPVLDSKDVILVHLDAKPAVGDIVVAQLATGGYVVKQVAERTREQIELASFNAAYPSIIARRDEVRLVGVVMARLAHSP